MICFISVVKGLAAYALAFCCFAVPLKAQDSLSQTEVRQLIDRYYQTFSEIEKTGNKQDLLQYLSPAYYRNLTYISAQGDIQHIREDYKTFAGYLQDIIDGYKETEIITTFAIQDTPAVHLSGNIAVASFAIQYQIRQQEQILTEGQSSNIFTLRKTKEGWKIILADLVWVEDALYKTQCSCRFSTNGAVQNTHFVRLTYPLSDRHKNALIHMRFMQPKTGAGKTILCNEKKYVWQYDNVYKTDVKGKITEQLGKAQNELQAMLLIIQQDAYKQYCPFVIERK
jgi:hypothetical protein